MEPQLGPAGFPGADRPAADGAAGDCTWPHRGGRSRDAKPSVQDPANPGQPCVHGAPSTSFSNDAGIDVVSVPTYFGCPGQTRWPSLAGAARLTGSGGSRHPDVIIRRSGDSGSLTVKGRKSGGQCFQFLQRKGIAATEVEAGDALAEVAGDEFFSTGGHGSAGRLVLQMLQSCIANQAFSHGPPGFHAAVRDWP